MAHIDFKSSALRFLITAVLIFYILIVPGYAETSMVKIGLFYGGSARDEYTVSADSSLELGISGAAGIDACLFAPSNSVNVRRDNSFHVLFYDAADKNDAKAKTDSLKAAGISAYPCYLGGRYRVLGGPFANENDALWASQNLAVKGSVAAPDSNLLVAADSSSGEILFMGEEVAVGSFGGRVNLSAVATKEYRGAMLFLQREGAISAINLVDREEYLYSVISREMSPSWHIEALKAQAVCARNYVENNRGKHEKYGFDLCDSVCCQAYSGTESETEGSYPPVDQTAGELLMYNGEVAETFYSSSMGPTTEDVKYVWGSSYPYLVSVDNPYEDYENIYNGKWENTLTKQRATEIMASKGYNVGDVTEIKILEFSPSGRVIKLLVRGTNGEEIFERESCRLIFSEVTLSQLYTISGGGTLSYPQISLQSSGGKTSSSSNGKTVISSSGKTALLDSFSVIGSGGKKGYSAATAGNSDEYVFSGMGWGHGVGMSQYGAKGMAEAGFDYKQILAHYFQGTEVVKR